MWRRKFPSRGNVSMCTFQIRRMPLSQCPLPSAPHSPLCSTAPPSSPKHIVRGVLLRWPQSLQLISFWSRELNWAVAVSFFHLDAVNKVVYLTPHPSLITLIHMNPVSSILYALHCATVPNFFFFSTLWNHPSLATSVSASSNAYDLKRVYTVHQSFSLPLSVNPIWRPYPGLYWKLGMQICRTAELGQFLQKLFKYHRRWFWRFFTIYSTFTSRHESWRARIRRDET